MSCAVFTILTVVQALFRKSNSWTLWATFALAILMLFVASFSAWRDQYMENETARSVGTLIPSGFNAVALKHGSGKSGTIRLSIALTNSQSRLVEYHVEKFDVTIESRPKEIVFSSRRGYVYPNNPATFSSGDLPIEDVTKTVVPATLDYEISYHAIGSKISHHTGKKLKIDFYPTQPNIPSPFTIVSEHED